MVKKILLLLTIVIFCSSCVPRKKIAYFQNIADTNLQTVEYSAKLQPDDRLLITVNAPYPYQELALPFNVAATQTTATADTGAEMGSATGATAPAGASYLIDKEGNIDFPVIGKIKLGGLTQVEALSLLNKKIEPYITKPIVDLRIINFKFTILGEVGRPGIYSTNGDKTTLPQALAMAGDLTIFGQRENILVIREKQGVKTYNYIDIRDTEFMNSDYYYITQNDLIVVEPNKYARNQSGAGRNLTIFISSISLLLTFYTVITR
ncbi:polysaccharide biosynthesis/export family protein [Flavobacterium rhizosphaerae]|uniref:Polysaccharide biosynthesis/export family protein n=1 Tax=Flavobacterium rhizosphaerae TaxID=3163298 RepID=A0ABW8Z0J7_9FLAO